MDRSRNNPKIAAKFHQVARRYLPPRPVVTLKTLERLENWFADAFLYFGGQYENPIVRVVSSYIAAISDKRHFLNAS